MVWHVWYYDQEVAFPDQKRKIAKWLGGAHHVGQVLCYYLLLPSGHTIVRSTIQPLLHDEMQSETVQEAIKHLHQEIKKKIVEIKQSNLLQEPIFDVYDRRLKTQK